MSGSRLVRHLVIWVAGTDRLIEDVALVDRLMKRVTARVATAEGILWATHDLDRESVCFSVMVQGRASSSRDGLPEARLRTRSSLRSALSETGLLEGARQRVGAGEVAPVQLRLDPMPLALHFVAVEPPAAEALN